ncbi:MAG TPA: iron-containing alcohol dehydrogenase, partial [Bacteroidales bacterium]|nr:iron-containing alcohol dehydrogenase [Bacteroidales bacterium]
MVTSFRFARIPQVYFGNGTLNELPSLAGMAGKKIVLVTGQKSFSESCYHAPLLEGLKETGHEIFPVSINGEPSAELIDDTVLSLDDKRPDLVVAVGGGSVIDAGKAISAMLLLKE